MCVNVPSGPEERDGERRLDGEAGAHHLAVDGDDHLAREAPGALVREPLEDLALALGIVGREVLRLLLAGDERDHVGALLEEREDLIIDRVDTAAEVVEAHALGQTHCVDWTRRGKARPAPRGHEDQAPRPPRTSSWMAWPSPSMVSANIGKTLAIASTVGCGYTPIPSGLSHTDQLKCSRSAASQPMPGTLPSSPHPGDPSSSYGAIAASPTTTSL